MFRPLIFFTILLSFSCVYAIPSYQANYELSAETDLGTFKFGKASYELILAKNAYVFRSTATTEPIWRALYDYSLDEISIGLISENRLISSYYQITESEGSSNIDKYEINIYPEDLYVSINGVKKDLNPGNIVDTLSVFLHISNDIQRNPDKKDFVYQVIDKKGVKQKNFIIKGIEKVEIGSELVETIKVVCPESKLTFNLAKDLKLIPVLINKTNGDTKYQLILKDYKFKS